MIHESLFTYKSSLPAWSDKVMLTLRRLVKKDDMAMLTLRWLVGEKKFDPSVSMLGSIMTWSSPTKKRSKYGIGHGRARLGGEANFGFPWILNYAW